MSTSYSSEEPRWLERRFLVSRSLPVLAMVAQPGPRGWWCDSVTLSLALPGQGHIHTHMNKEKGEGKKKKKRCWCYLTRFWKKRNCWFCVCCWCCLKSGKQNTCSPLGTSTSLAAHNDVEHFVFMAVQCDLLLSPCFLCDSLGWILFAISTHWHGEFRDVGGASLVLCLRRT